MVSGQGTAREKISFALAPQDINGGINTDILNTQLYDRITFIVILGVLGAATTMTVEECDDTTPSNSTAIAFDYEKVATALGDDWGVMTAATSSGITIGGSDDNKMIAVEIEAADLTDAYPYVRLAFSDPSSADFVAVVAIGHSARYLQDSPPTMQT